MRARRQRNLSRHQKIFSKIVFHTKATPLWDGTIFGQVFVKGGMIKSSKWKVPPTGGQARRNRLLVSWGPLVIAAPRVGSLLAPSGITRSHADARLRSDARGRDGGVRQELAAGVNRQEEPSSLRAPSMRTRVTPPLGNPGGVLVWLNVKRKPQTCRGFQGGHMKEV